MFLFRLFALLVAIYSAAAEEEGMFSPTTKQRAGFQATAFGHSSRAVSKSHLFQTTNDALRGGAILGINGKRDVAKPKKLGLVEHIVLAFRELAESAAYGFVYALFSLLFAGWVDSLFPKYNTKQKYTTVGLLLQVAAQAGMNACMAQFTRRLVSRLPLLDRIDGRSDKRLPAAGGGVVFAYLMFSRQTNWKSKVTHLDSLLDKTQMFA